jgi:putative RecB family exonuclease
MTEDYISFSQFNLCCRCGVQYKLRYIDGIKIPPSTSLINGKDYHSTVEMNHRQKVNSAADLPLADLKDFYASAVETEFKGEVLFSKDEKGKAKGTVLDETIKRGHAALGVYHKNWAPSLQPLEIEKVFLAPLGDDLPPLKGVIDLITSDMRVVDHKTASKSPSKDEGEKSMQLSGYAIGFHALYGYLPEELELQYSVVPESLNAKPVSVKTRRSAEQLDSFKERVKLVVNAIRFRVFTPPEQSSWACGYCGYKDAGICKL